MHEIDDQSGGEGQGLNQPPMSESMSTATEPMECNALHQNPPEAVVQNRSFVHF